LSILESLILGAVQGITEFLPISSSAHLIALPAFFKIQDGNINKLTYDVMLHCGTLCAVLLIYGKKFMHIVWGGMKDYRHGKIKDVMLTKLIFATLPAAFCGLLFQKIIEMHLRTPFVVIFTLVLVSFLMFIAERAHPRKRGISYPVAFIIGVAQAFALIPGVSRSGITIVAGIFLGLTRDEAVDFSFILSIPIILGASLYELRHINYQGGGGEIYLAGAISAFIFGALSLRFLIGYLKEHSLDVFAYYRVVLASLIMFFAL
jgi:undecaprenyl-diphosphatase